MTIVAPTQAVLVRRAEDVGRLVAVLLGLGLFESDGERRSFAEHTLFAEFRAERKQITEGGDDGRP